MHEQLVVNIKQLVTLKPLARKKTFVKITEDDLGIYQNCWMRLLGGKIQQIGTGALPQDSDGLAVIDAQNQLVLPGLVDSHTHPIFAGDRSNEFKSKLAGLSYQEIAAQGGGIQVTVDQTRAASNETLMALAKSRVQSFLKKGVTTVEVKSGYGLSVAEELRHCEILRELSENSPMSMKITCLALHAIPKEFANTEDYVEAVNSELLPELARRGLADYVDAFIENGYFKPEDCESYFTKAKELGLGVRIHADEFSPSGGAEAAVAFQAKSADHLQFCPKEVMPKLAEQNVVATLLPGTSLYSDISYAQARPFLEAGCMVALASDYNPGSCQINHLGLIASIGARYCGMNYQEAIAAVTLVPAYSMDLHQSKGHLSEGADGDFAIYPCDSAAQWLASFGSIEPRQVFIAGSLVASAE